MNKTFLAAVVVSGLIMTGCGSSDAPEFDRSIGPTPDSVKPATVNTVNGAQPATLPANLQTTPVNAQPQAVQVQPQQVTTSTTAPATTTAKGMNPPHGQPGHRCEIAVGAPLNSAPAAAAKPQTVSTTSTPQVVSAPAQVSATPAATPTVTAPGMNPPHGQPGHDCSIAVGAPLKKAN